jgi:hypothetical protein
MLYNFGIQSFWSSVWKFWTNGGQTQLNRVRLVTSHWLSALGVRAVLWRPCASASGPPTLARASRGICASPGRTQPEHMQGNPCPHCVSSTPSARAEPRPRRPPASPLACVPQRPGPLSLPGLLRSKGLEPCPTLPRINAAPVCPSCAPELRRLPLLPPTPSSLLHASPPPSEHPSPLSTHQHSLLSLALPHTTLILVEIQLAAVAATQHRRVARRSRPTFNSDTNQALGGHRPLPRPWLALIAGELAGFRPPALPPAPRATLRGSFCFQGL